jgi:hypothetical protein
MAIEKFPQSRKATPASTPVGSKTTNGGPVPASKFSDRTPGFRPEPKVGNTQDR